MTEYSDTPGLSQHLRERLASLSSEQRKALEEKLRQTRKDRSNGDAIPPVPAESSIPLSFAQEHVWFLDQLLEVSPLYNIKKAFHLRGPVVLDALQQALSTIVDRHEPLRTRIVSGADEPRQLVDASTDVRLQLHDLRDAAPSERNARLEQILAEEARRPFDLSGDLMLRATVIRLSDEEQVLFLVLHHISADRWSIEILLRELSLLYGAALQGDSAALPPLSVRYADYAAWERDGLGSGRLEEVVRYWKERLSDAPSLELPVDHPHATPEDIRGGMHAFEVPDELAVPLRQLARQERATLFMVMLAAFKAWLHRSTGQTDLVVGSPMANRARPELESLIGMFVGTLVLRTDLSNNPSFRRVIEKVRSGTLEGLKHRDVSFEKLGLWTADAMQHQLQIRGLFTMQNTPEAVLRLPGIDVEPIFVSSDTAKFDLSLSIYDTSSGLSGCIRYNASLFERETIERMACQYLTLLSAAVAEPDRSIGSLPLLTDAERHRILVTWNETKEDFPATSVHALVEAQVLRTPEAAAVAFEDRMISYAELNDRAANIAYRLGENGIGEGTFVPVMIDRSIELVAALLGVMKSGAAFVPVDANWPTERIASILDELACEVVLIDSSSADHTALRERKVMLADEIVSGANNGPQPSGAPEAPIYAIYTSGSTGRPKAAVVPHRGIVNRLTWMNRFFGPHAAASVLQTTRPTFDSAVWQLFWPLINGGMTVIPSPARDLTSDYITELIETRRITLTDFVPSIFNDLVPQLVSDEAARRRWESIRFLVLGGEELSPEAVRTFLKAIPEVRIVNLYGPTEASIGCIYYEVRPEDDDRVPIGRPISNVSAVILDAYGNPVPVGITGELHIGGVCVGSGYLNDAEKTLSSFIPNPFPEIYSDRLYRTGDRAAYGPDGNIFFRGRADRQVKIRGMRIEPGEIEAALRQDQVVQDAAVVAYDRPELGKRLAAYVVFRDAAALDPAAGETLKRRLRERLPAHMVPSDIISLGALPVLPGGKTDRLALPSPDAMRLERPFVAPRSELEKQVAAIWSDLLGFGRIGAEDDFFEIGGHSLLALRLIGRLRDTLGIQLPLRHFFEASTVASLSQLIEAVRWTSQDAAAGGDGATSDREEIEL